MKKFYLLLFLFIFIAPNSYSQKTLSDYSYIVVSEQFEFQKDKDKYQLNSLTKFLFNKHGFHAYFEKDVPKNVNRCDGLIADAEGTPGFIYTVVELVIKDCYGTEIFRTRKGRSKLKDYKKAYYECMREAFVDIEVLEVNQKEISTDQGNLTTYSVKEEVNKTTETKVVSGAVVEKTNTEKPFKTSVINLPTSKYTSYTFLNTMYLLQKTKAGYFLYKETETTSASKDGLLLIGKITINTSSLSFLNTINGTMTEASFSDSKDLIVGKEGDEIVYKIEN